MTEVKLVATDSQSKFITVLRMEMESGWSPKYESFQVSTGETWTHFAILVTRP